MNSIWITSQSYEADQQAERAGLSGEVLMENAGSAVARHIQANYAKCQVVILCGPGSNGGDGYVIGRLLREKGWTVQILAFAKPQTGSVSHAMASQIDYAHCESELQLPARTELIVDCLLGAGLSRAVDGRMGHWITSINAGNASVISVDLPSGIQGDLAFVTTTHVKAERTITFEALKPAHVLLPTSAHCGQIEVVSIGMPNSVIDSISEQASVNHPDLWPHFPMLPAKDTYKHQRGKVLVCMGNEFGTGAGRLAGQAALRIGAGWVALAGYRAALDICASAVSTEVLELRGPGEALNAVLQRQNPNVVLIGPAGGVGAAMRDDVIALLQSGIPSILDADALTSFADDPETLIANCHQQVILLPHAGEFYRLFPGLKGIGNKIEQTKQAAKLAGCALLFKGYDSVMADQSGRAIVNTHASPWLASMGTGDVLAGMVASLLAQQQSKGQSIYTPIHALAASVWMHGELGRQLGAGLIAGDLPDAIPKMLADLL